MHLTTLTPAHLPALYDLIRSLDLGVYGDMAFLRQRTLEDPQRTPETLLVAEGDDGDLLGFCIARAREGRANIALFAVRPDQRRRGVGTALFDALEARLRARGVNDIIIQGYPRYFTPAVDLRCSAAITFLLGRGYTTDRTALVDLRVHLSSAPLETQADEDRLAQAGITVRRARADELSAAAHFALQVFSLGWYLEVSDAALFEPLPLFVALAGDAIIGFATYDVGGQDRFGPTGVRPDYRGQGIGGVLLKQCLRAMRERGSTHCEIGWAGPLAFYSKLVDARISNVYWVFKKSLGK